MLDHDVFCRLTGTVQAVGTADETSQAIDYIAIAIAIAIGSAQAQHVVVSTPGPAGMGPVHAMTFIDG